MITDIDISSPTSGGQAGQGDDDIRQLKIDIAASFPNINGAVTVTPAQLNQASEISDKANLAGPQTLTGTHTLNGILALSSSASITANGVSITDNELAYVGTLTSDAQTQINARALLNGSVSNRFDVAAPNANDQAIRRDTYAASTTGGTVKMRVSGTTLYIRNDGTTA